MHLSNNNFKNQKIKLGFCETTCNLGLHLAYFYDNFSNRDDLIINFFKQGFKNNDIQFFNTFIESEYEFKNKMLGACPEYEKNINDSSSIIFHKAKDFYFPEGNFVPEHVIDRLSDFYEKQLNDQNRNIRSASDAFWIKKADVSTKSFMKYESLLNKFLIDKPWIGICAFNINLFTGKEIMQILQTHPYTIYEGEIIENPYYLEPEFWLKDNIENV